LTKPVSKEEKISKRRRRNSNIHKNKICWFLK
jgi:hypothetical protein